MRRLSTTLHCSRRAALWLRLCAVVTLLMLLPADAGVVRACAIDNTASLFANGVQATLTTTAPASVASVSQWAHFTINTAFGRGDVVQFSEARSDLARTLSPAALAAPYRWEFGDGTATLGHTVSHRYSRPGTYRLTVYDLAAPNGRWSQFDDALVRIVPPGQLFSANLGYTALNALGTATSILMALVTGALGVFVVFVAVSAQRRSRKTAPTDPHGEGRAAP